MADYLICLEKAMVVLTTNEEIDQYLQGMFREECLNSSKLKRIHRYVFNKLREIIGIRIPEDVWLERTSHIVTPFNQQRLRGWWQQRLMELEQNSIILAEEYNIKEGIAILTWSRHCTYSRQVYVEERLSIRDRDQACVTTILYREIDTHRQRVLEREVCIREYDDYYEEEITGAFSRGYREHNDNPEISLRTVWKRDLFREEYHTIPYQPDPFRTTLFIRFALMV